MTLLCIAQSPWWSITTDEPTTGPQYLEICHGRRVVEKGITGYVIEGYGAEPFDARMFVEIREVVAKGREEFEYA